MDTDDPRHRLTDSASAAAVNKGDLIGRPKAVRSPTLQPSRRVCSGEKRFVVTNAAGGRPPSFRDPPLVRVPLHFFGGAQLQDGRRKDSSTESCGKPPNCFVDFILCHAFAYPALSLTCFPSGIRRDAGRDIMWVAETSK